VGEPAKLQIMHKACTLLPNVKTVELVNSTTGTNLFAVLSTPSMIEVDNLIISKAPYIKPMTVIKLAWDIFRPKKSLTVTPTLHTYNLNPERD
jgi:hypothetical protein